MRQIATLQAAILPLLYMLSFVQQLYFFFFHHWYFIGGAFPPTLDLFSSTSSSYVLGPWLRVKWVQEQS